MANNNQKAESALNAINGEAAAGPVAAKERALDPQVLAQIAAFKMKIQAGVGEVVLAMLNLPRYRTRRWPMSCISWSSR